MNVVSSTVRRDLDLQSKFIKCFMKIMQARCGKYLKSLKDAIIHHNQLCTRSAKQVLSQVAGQCGITLPQASYKYHYLQRRYLDKWPVCLYKEACDMLAAYFYYNRSMSCNEIIDRVARKLNLCQYHNYYYRYIRDHMRYEYNKLKSGAYQYKVNYSDADTIIQAVKDILSR